MSVIIIVPHDKLLVILSQIRLWHIRLVGDLEMDLRYMICQRKCIYLGNLIKKIIIKCFFLYVLN